MVWWLDLIWIQDKILKKKKVYIFAQRKLWNFEVCMYHILHFFFFFYCPTLLSLINKVHWIVAQSLHSLWAPHGDYDLPEQCQHKKSQWMNAHIKKPYIMFGSICIQLGKFQFHLLEQSTVNVSLHIFWSETRKWVWVCTMCLSGGALVLWLVLLDVKLVFLSHSIKTMKKVWVHLNRGGAGSMWWRRIVE